MVNGSEQSEHFVHSCSPAVNAANTAVPCVSARLFTLSTFPAFRPRPTATGAPLASSRLGQPSS